MVLWFGSLIRKRSRFPDRPFAIAVADLFGDGHPVLVTAGGTLGYLRPEARAQTFVPAFVQETGREAVPVKSDVNPASGTTMTVDSTCTLGTGDCGGERGSGNGVLRIHRQRQALHDPCLRRDLYVFDSG